LPVNLGCPSWLFSLSAVLPPRAGVLRELSWVLGAVDGGLVAAGGPAAGF
jgi:hypothetical protein